MPPRYAYWTILIDGKATAFRAKEREELLPTLNQLRRKNTDVTLRYFAKGKLWDSPEQAQWAGRNTGSLGDKRDRDWRPGGEHKDPRARFDKKPKEREGARPYRRDERDSDRPRTFDRDQRRDSREDRRPQGGARPWTPKGEHRDRQDQGSRKPFGGHQDQNDRSLKDRPRESGSGARRFDDREGDRRDSREGMRGESGRKAWTPKAPRGDWRDREQRDTRDRERPDTRDRGDRPRPEGKRPFGPPKGEGDARPWSGKPGGRKPWTPKPSTDTRDRADRPAPERRPWTPGAGQGQSRRFDERKRDAGSKRFDDRGRDGGKPFKGPNAGGERSQQRGGDRGSARFDDRERRSDSKSPGARDQRGPKRFDDRGRSGAPKRFDDQRREGEKPFKGPKGPGRPDRFDSRSRDKAEKPFKGPKAHTGRFDERNRKAPKGHEREAPKPTPEPRREEPPAREERPERPPSAEQVVTKPEPPERG